MNTHHNSEIVTLFYLFIYLLAAIRSGCHKRIDLVKHGGWEYDFMYLPFYESTEMSAEEK